MRESIATMSLADIRSWLVERIASYLDCSPASVELDADLVRYGFDSVQALSVSGDFEDTFGVEVPAALLLDTSTVREIADRVYALVRP
jgi:acyl carrier protein